MHACYVTFEDLDDARFQYEVQVYARTPVEAIQTAKVCVAHANPAIRLGRVRGPIQELPEAPETERLNTCVVNRVFSR